MTSIFGRHALEQRKDYLIGQVVVGLVVPNNI